MCFFQKKHLNENLAMISPADKLKFQIFLQFLKLQLESVKKLLIYFK